MELNDVLYASCMKGSSANSGPWSECNISGDPKMPMMRLIMACATVTADLLGIGVNTVNRVRWPIMEITYLHRTPAAETDSALYSTKSTEIRSNGLCTGTCPAGNLFRLCAVFLR